MGPVCSMSRPLPIGTSGTTSTKTTSASSLNAMFKAQLAPTLPPPTTVTLCLIESAIITYLRSVTLYFDDYVVDSMETSRGRTITEADIVNFAGLSGDFVELHVNEEYAKRGPFGKRIAHGALIFSMSTGLMMQMPGDPEAIIAFYGV